MTRRAVGHGTSSTLLGRLPSFRGRVVAVLADLVVDEFLYGDIARVSREAPVLVLEHVRTVAVPGGGGNGVANLQALGARPLPVGVVGRDEAGRRLLEALERRRVDLSHVLVVPGYDTPCKTRILAGGVHTRRQQIVRVDRGAAHRELRPAVRARLEGALRRALGRAEGLLITDYGYGVASPRVARTALADARRRGLPVTVDSRRRVAQFHGITACTPNQEELERALERESIGDADVAAAARDLCRRCRARAVLVTRGARGMVLVEEGKPALTIAAYGSGEVADVTGAGDTVIATFTLALLAGASLAEAARLSNYAAGLVVTKTGTATVSSREVRQAIRGDGAA